MEPDINQIIASAIVALALVAWRWLRRRRFWQRVEAAAERIIADANIPIEDPKQAAERALIEAHRAQLDTVERSLRNGHQ